MILDLAHFMEKEQPLWTELEDMLSRMEADPLVRLDMQSVKRLHYLYERACTDLTKISVMVTETEIRHYLESLVSRAYGEIHEVREQTARFKPLTWFFTTFPRTFRQHIRCFWLALAIMMAGGLFGGFALVLDSEAKASLITMSHLRGNPSERVAREESAMDDERAGSRTLFSSYLMTHNIKVSIFAMALGMTWGIGTIVILFNNGVLLGSVAADYIAAGEIKFLAAWLLPHGSVEIPSILIAGQAGLMLGSALIGWDTRASLKMRLRSSAPALVNLVGGLAVLLVWAGIVESFFSQYHEPHIPYAMKIGFGVTQLGALTLFLARSGRRGQPSNATGVGGGH